MMRLYVVSTTLLVLGLSVTSYLFLEGSVASELDAWTDSQLTEFRIEFEKRQTAAGELASSDAPAVPIDSAMLKEIAETVTRRQRNPLAWRIWEVNWGRVKGEFGATELLTEEYPAIEPINRTRREAGALRWRSELLSKGLTVGVVLDGSEQIAELRRYQTFAAGLGVLAALVSFVVGAFMTQRMSKLLRNVAKRARGAHMPQVGVDEEAASHDFDIDVEDAPDEIREVVEALRQLFSNIRAESERSRVFYASIAHELRSPIQNLVGQTEVALFSERDGKEYRRVLESNLDELRDLGDAIDNMVTICAENRPGAGDELEEFDLLDETVIKLTRERSLGLRRGVELEVGGEGELRMRADREGILRAVRNLAANAIQWSPEGSKVWVHMKGEGESIRVTVDDAGPGVPEKLRQEIFSPFVRGPSSGGRIGYGLGLAIVRSAVEAQGGTIEIGASPVGGARFEVVLPRQAPGPAGPRDNRARD